MSDKNTARGGIPRAFSRRYRNHLIEPYGYLAPALLFILAVIVVPLVVGISYSFYAMKLIGPQPKFVGLTNYLALWQDKTFWIALENTLVWTFGSLFFQFFLGLGLALLLNTQFWGKKMFQALVFLPWAVPTFLSALTWAWLFNPIIGPLPHWMYALGLIDGPNSILGDPDLAIWGPIAANVWFGVPFFAITLLAALQSIPSELYEAAEIDGANSWQRFTKITLPFLAPMIAITVMLRTIWIANFADLIFIMTAGGPANSTQILSTYIFTTAFRKLDFGYASTIAVAMLALLFIYAVFVMVLRRKLVKV